MPDIESSKSKYDSKLVSFSRTLRERSTSAEPVLWRALRSGRLEGLKFRRQQPIGPFIADFYCARLKLVIELDGDPHAGREQRDMMRQQYLEEQGLTVIRFFNSDVRDNLDGVLQAIYAHSGMGVDGAEPGT